MSCCIGRRGDQVNDPNENAQIASRELKKQLQSIESQGELVSIFNSVMRSEDHWQTLVRHFEQIHSPELPYFIQAFMKWEKEPTKEGAENLLNNYFVPDALYQLDVQNGDEKRIRFLLNDFPANRDLMHDMFQKYALASMRDIKNCYNPKV
jgi:hypothetical protein